MARRKKHKSPSRPSRGPRWFGRKFAKLTKRRARLKTRRARLRLEQLENRIALATTTIDLPSLVLNPADSLSITIGGPQAGNPAGGTDSDGYDQVRVGNDASLGGTLRVSLANDYVPEVGTVFDVLKVDGSLSGKFAGAEGLFSFPSGDRYFKVVESADQRRLSLEVAKAPGGLSFAPSSRAVSDAFGTFLNEDYFTGTTQADFTGSISTPGFVDLAGAFTFEERGSAITASAARAAVFMGTGHGSGRETGARIADTGVGLLLKDDGYALAASGAGQFVGLHGLNLTASFDVSANTTAGTINTTVGGVTIASPAGTKSFATKAAAGGTISVSGGFTLQGDLALTKIPTGLVLVDATDMELSLLAGNIEAYHFSGVVRFGMDQDRGFQLLDTSFDKIKLLGTNVLGRASSVNSLTYPADTLGPAALTTVIGAVDVAVLNHRRYIDVTFTSSTGRDIDPDSITDNGQEFFFSGSGLEDADFYTTVHLSGNTYRYYLLDKNSKNDDTKDAFKGDLFRVNENFSSTKLTLNFIAGAWKDVDGNECYPATEDMIAVDGTTLVSQQTVDIRSGITVSTADVELGPLVLKGPYFNLEELQLAPPEAGNPASRWSLVSSVAMGVDSATFKFGEVPKKEGEDQPADGQPADGQPATGQPATGQPADGQPADGEEKKDETTEKVKTAITGLLGTFNINSVITPTGDARSSPGKFLISVLKAEFEVKGIVKAEASGVYIGYDPLIDKNYDGVVSEDERKAFNTQEMLRVDEASVKLPEFGLAGRLTQYTRPAEAIDPRTGGNIGGTTVPGLSVRRDGFHLGEASLTMNEKVPFGKMLLLEEVTGGVQDIDVSFRPSFRMDVDGGFFVAAKKAVLFPGKKFEMTLTDSKEDSDEEGVRATIKFTDNLPTGFAMKVDQGELKMGPSLKVNAENFIIDTTATGINPVVGFDSLKASLKAGPLWLSGQIRNFGLLSDGSMQIRAGFGVFFGVESVDPKKLVWPAWLPIQPTEVGIQWRNLNADPADFKLVMSANVTAIKGLPKLNVTGTIKGAQFDVGALLRGENPLTGIESMGVTVTGDMFGGKVTGGLIGGIIPISSSGNEVPTSDFVTPIVDRVFFVGLMGGFEIAKKGGFTIRMALTENGPLGVQVTGELPQGVLLEPVSGLKLTGFSGGVEFFKQLNDAEHPEDLLDPNFDPALSNSSKIDASQWERQVRSQTVAQYKAIKEGTQGADFLAAFRSPLLISGGAQIQFHTPAEVLKANAEVRISIDPNVDENFNSKGLPKVKILLTGDLILFGGLQRVPARIFANLTELQQGRAKLIMMAQDIPAGLHPIVPFIPTPFPFAIPVPTSLELQGYVEFKYLGPDGKPVDFFDAKPAVTVPTATLVNPLGNGSIPLGKFQQNGSLDIKFTPTSKAADAAETDAGPVLDEASITDSGAEIRLVLPDGTVVPIAGNAVRPAGAADGVYRYQLPANIALVPGTYQVRVLDGSFADSTGKLNAEQELSFEVAVPRAVLAGPADGSRIDRDAINRSRRLAVRFLPTPGTALTAASITDAAAEIVLSGAAAGVALGQPVRDPADDRLYWYPFTGDFATGPVTVTVPAGAFTDSGGNGNPESVSTFAVTGPEMALRNPSGGTSLTLAELNRLGYLEVFVTSAGGAAIDESSLTDTAAEFTLINAGPGVTVSGVAVPVPGEPNVYRYAVTGSFAQPGEVRVKFIDGGFQDVEGITAAGRTESFVIRGVEAALVDPTPLAIAGLNILNDRGYFDVRFTPTDGATLDESTITDNGAEFELSGAAATGVTVSGAGVPLGGGVYRYAFTGSFGTGAVEVNWLPRTVTDSRGFQTLASATTFQVAAPAVELASPRNEQRVNRSKFNGDHFIDILFADTTGRGLAESTIKDAGQEFKLLVKDSTGKEWVEPLGVGINGNPLKQADGTYRYFFSGTLEPGLVRVVFLGGSFADTAGVVNAESEQQFIVVSDAPAFQITTEGTLFYRTGFKSGLFGDLSNPEHLKSLLKLVEPVMKEILGDDQDAALETLTQIIGTVNTGLDVIKKFIDTPLMTMHGYVRLGAELLIDPSGKINGARTTLDASGGVSVIVAGPVGAAAGRVVIEAGSDVGFGLWGVMELQAKLDFLTQVGIDFRGFANLQFNSTNTQRIESLSLEGFGEGGSTLTQTYQIPATSFQIAAAGKMIFHQPRFDGSDPLGGPELFRISGVASLGINENGMQMFSKGDVEVGPSNIRLLDISGLGVFAITSKGVAGDLQVDVAIGKIPAIADYFRLDASARVVFNSTGEEVQVKVLDRFLEYLPEDFKKQLVTIGNADEQSGGGTFTGSASKAYVVGAAPPPRPVSDGTPAPAGPYFVVEAAGNLMIAGAFRVHGDFYFEINASPEMFVTLNGSMALDPLGAAVISGTFHVDQYGAYGGLQIGGSLAAGPLKIFGASQLEFNTQAVAAQISRYKFDFANKRVSDERETVTLLPGAFAIHVAGYLELAGSFKLQGQFQLENKPDVIAVHVDAKFEAFGASMLYVNGNANIVKGGNAGFVCNLVATARSPVEFPGVFELNANFVLQVNSRGGSGRDAYDLGLDRSSFLVRFDGKLAVLSSLELSGSGLIEYRSGVFRMDVSMRTNFFGFASLNANGFFSSEGEFELYLGGGFGFGQPGFLGVQAGGSIYVGLLDNNGKQPFGDGNTVLTVSGGLNGRFWIFGYGVGASVGVNYSSGTGLLSVSPRATIDFFLFSIDVGTTFNIGTLKANPPIYVAGNADDSTGQPFRGGALYLNMGPRARWRGYDQSEVNEHFKVEYVAEDEQNGGVIVRVDGLGVKRTYRGVTSIVADGAGGRDSIETSADLPVPVVLRGGAGRDRIIHRGSGPAVIDGGQGDDELFGGTGANTFVVTEGDGNDDIVTFGGAATLDLNGVRSNLLGSLGSGAIDLDRDGTSDVTYGGLALASDSVAKTTSAPVVVRLPEDDPITGPRYVPLRSVHDGDARLVVAQPGHPFRVGDQVTIASGDAGLGPTLRQQATWRVAAVTADSWSIDLAANRLGHGASATATWRGDDGGNRKRQVTVLHDGANTAIVYDPGHGVGVGDRVLLDSEDSAAYLGEFVITAVTPNSYSFALAFDSVRDRVGSGLTAATVRLGAGDDLVKLSGTDAVSYSLSDAAGGLDEVFIAGGLPAVVSLTPGGFKAGSLNLGLGGGLDRLTLSSPTQALSLAGDSAGVDLGDLGLRVVAPGVALGTDITAAHVVVETRDTLRVDRSLTATRDGFIDLRVFGDAADVVLDRPLTVSKGTGRDVQGTGWIRLVAPDGSITGGSSLAFDAPNSHLIYKAKNAPTGPLETRIAKLTFAYGPHGTPGDVSITEQDDLVLTNVDDYDTPFAPGLVYGAGPFAGSNWVTAAPQGWLDQVIGGKSPDAVVVPAGSLTIRLLGRDSLLFLDSGRIVVQAAGKDMTFRADDISFRSGAAQVVGTGVLSIEANQAVWNYRLGTAGENAAGSDLARDAFADSMDLTSGDLAALADGFSRIVIGRKDAGNTMILGDAADAKIVKFTGQSRERDARFRDPTLLLTDTLTVAGDVVATGRLEVEAAGTAIVQGPNLHVPTGPIDSGLSAVELILKVGDVLQVSGWLIAAAVLDAVVGGDFTLDVGASVETRNDNNSFKVAAAGAMNVAGRIEAKGAGGRPQLDAGGSFALEEGGVISAPGAGAVVNIRGGSGVSMAGGTAILAGVAIDSSSGSPVASVTGAGSNVVIESPREVFLPGTVAASQGIELRGGTPGGDRSGLFEALVPAGHPLRDRSGYGILVTGTLLTFGDATDLVLASVADVIVRGNIDLRGKRSSLVVQSDTSVFFEGLGRVADGDVALYGGVRRDGTDVGGADATGTSVTVYKASTIRTGGAGSRVDIRGSKDVDILGTVVAGGDVGPAGVTWAAGGDATITVRAGQQVMLDSALQASRSVTVTGGTPGADDNGLSVLLSPASGINAAGLSGDTTATGLVAIDAAGDLEMMGAITSGATIVESAAGRTYDWAGHLASDVGIKATGRAYIGGNTVNKGGDPITTGGFIRAGRGLTIAGGTHTSGNGVQVHPNSELSTRDAAGTIVITSGQDAEIRGKVAGGGEIVDGVVSLFDGTAAVRVEAAHQVRISREVAASQRVIVVGGTDPLDPADSTSGQSVVVAGTGLLRTQSVNGSISVTGPQGMTFFSPLELTAYNVQAPGLDSTIAITSTTGGTLKIGGRIQGYRDIQLNGLSPTTGDRTEGSSVELTETSLLETIDGSIVFDAGPSGIVLGSLSAGGAGRDVTITSAGDLTVKGNLKAADAVVLGAAGVLDVSGSVLAGNGISLQAGTAAAAGQTDLFIRDTAVLATTAADARVALLARNDISIDGTVGSRAGKGTNDPVGMPYGAATVATTTSVESTSGSVTVVRNAGRLESGATLGIKANVIDVAGVIRNAGSTAAAGSYDVTFTPGTLLKLSGDVAVNGSMLVKSPAALAVTGGLRVSGDHLLRIEAPQLTVGTAEAVAGIMTEQGGVIASGGRLEIVAPQVALRSAGQVLATGQGSSIRIDADYLDVVGGIRGGADVQGGRVAWTGTGANVALTIRQMLSLGGQGYDAAGVLADVGGTLAATGSLDIRVTGGTAAVGVHVANNLGLIETDATGGGLLAATAPSSISITTDLDMHLSGLVRAVDDGADITLEAGKLLKIDGLVQADDLLTATAGTDDSSLSIYLTATGVLNTGDGGGISLTGAKQLLIEGSVGQPRVEAGATVVDTGSVRISTPEPFDLKGSVFAQSLVRIEAPQINVLSGGSVRVTRAGGLIDARATGNLLVAGGGQMLSSGSVRLFGRNIRVDGFVDNDNGAASPLVLANAVESIVVTGAITSKGDLRLSAGVGAGWSDARLTGAVSAADLTGGLVRVQGAGKVTAAGVLKLTAGTDVELQADPDAPTERRSVQTPTLTYRPQTIDVVVGYRQVAGGIVYTPVVTWVDTKAEVQTGVELVKNGSFFRTMDVTLTQDGYFDGTTKREYLIQGLDYANSASERQNPTAPVIDWAGDAPAAGATFSQLSDAQQGRVLATLGFKPLFDFSFTNAKEQRTQNGSSSVVPWTPAWSTAAKHIVQLAVPGLEGKYIRLPIDAELDLLRVVTQGAPTTFQEDVGTFIDTADARYTQDRSRYTGADDLDKSGVRYAVSYVGSGRRTYSLNDGFGGELDATPVWGTSVDTEVGLDANSKSVLAPLGFLPDTASLANEQLVGTRPDVVVLDPAIYPMLKDSPQPKTVLQFIRGTFFNHGQAIIDASKRGGYVAAINSAREEYWAETLVNAGATRPNDFVGGLLGGFYAGGRVTWWNGEPTTYSKILAAAPNEPFIVLGIRMNRISPVLPSAPGWITASNPSVASGYLLERSAVENFNDYQFDWTSKVKTVEDTRLTLGFQWTGNSHDLFTEVPVFSLADTKVAVERQVATTGWVSEPITEQRTVIKPVRVILEQPAVAVSAFSGDSLHSDRSLVIDAGRDVTLSGLVTARDGGRTTGSIDIVAGRDFFMTGAKPAGAADDSLPATAGMTAVSRVTITTGGRFTLASSIDIKADDSAVTGSTENKIVVTTAGDAIIRGTLTTTNRQIGEVTVNAGDDIEIKGEILSGHVANVLAGTDGTGGITSDISGHVRTLGSEVHFAAGKSGGSISLTDLFIETAGPLTLAAPSGSISSAGGLLSAGSLSGTADSGIDLGSVAAGKLSADVTGTGTLKVFVYGSTIIDRLTTANGGIGLQGTGDMALGNVSAGGADNAVRVDPVEVLDAKGNRVLFTPTLSGNVPFADPLYLVSEGGKTITTATGELHLNVVSPGAVTVNHTGSGPLTVYVSAMDGSVTINTDGDLIVVDLRLLSNKPDNTVNLNAGGDVLIGRITAGDYAADAAAADALRLERGLAADAPFTSLTGLTIKAGGAIREIGAGDADIDVVAGRLSLEAGTGIGGLGLAVNEVTKAVTTAGSITLVDNDGVGELSRGLNLIEARAAKGGVSVTTTGSLQVGAVTAGGLGQRLVLAANGGGIEVREREGITAGLTSAGTLDLSAAGDVTLAGRVTANGGVTVTSAAGVRAAASDFRWSAGGPLAIDAAGSVVLGGAITAVKSVSIVSGGGDVVAPVAITPQSGTLEELRLAAGGNLVVTGGSIPSVTKTLSLTAGRELALGLTQPAFAVTGTGGRLTISAGGDLPLLADTVLRADARITLASTGYTDDHGNRQGGSLSLLATPQGFATELTKELFLTGSTVLHLSPAATATDLVKLGGRVMFSRSGSLLLQADRILGAGGASAGVLAALAGSTVTYSAPKLELADGAVLVLEQGADGTDQLDGLQQITLTGGSAGVEVPEGSSVSLDLVFTGPGGLRKLGGGVLILGGKQTYTGPTRVEAGTLLVNGSTAAGSAVTVAGGSLGGTGTVAGPVTVGDGGTLLVGPQPAGIGALTTGSLAFEAGSTLVLEVSPTAADTLSVNGSLTVSPDASVRVTALDGFVPVKTPRVLIQNDTRTDPVTGRFGTVIVTDTQGNTLLSGLMYTAGDGNDVALISDGDPPTGGAVVDGQTSDIDVQSSLTTITANWSGFTDGDGTGIDRYEWAIGTTPGAQNVMAFTGDGITGTKGTRSGLALASGVTYYVSIRAIDKAGNIGSAVTSDGVMADAVAPAGGTVTDGPTVGVDIAYQQSLAVINASWSGFADTSGSGIDRYEWAIGTTPGAANVLAFTGDGITGTRATRSGLALASGVTYYVSVRAIDKADNISPAVTSNGVMADAVAPVPGTVIDGPTVGLDIAYQQSLAVINASWSGFADTSGSGIDRYEWAIGTTPGAANVMAFTGDGITGTRATRSGLSLTSGTTYYVSIRAIDRAGNISSAVTSDGVMADAVAPAGGTVTDGPTVGLDIAYQQSLAVINASWSGVADTSGSGIDRYEWAIGTTPGAANVMAFTGDGITGTRATRSGLNLTSGTTYYVSVRAIDKAGNVGPAVTSDGVMADAVAPSGGTVTDGPTVGLDIAYQQSLAVINASWSGVADTSGSGIDRYEWAIGTTPGAANVMAFTSDGITGTKGTRSGLALTSGTTYYVSVRAIDKAANIGSAVTSDGVMADAVAPVAGTVTDGPTAGADISYQRSASVFAASWSGFADPSGSGIDRYEWAIGTTPGGQDAMAFTSVGLATSAATSGLTLRDNVRYHVTIRAIDRAGNSTPVASDGVIVYSLPPVVTAANIRLSGGTAGIGAFKPLDTVTARWNDTPAGDNNSHVLTTVTVDFSGFGGPKAVPATRSNGVWTASHRIPAGFTGSNRNVAFTVTDLVGNRTTTSGTDNAMIAIPGSRMDFTDSDGERYRVQLTGPGLLAVDIAAGANGRGPIQRIQVAGTDPARSALTVVPLTLLRNSDKRVSIGAIAGSGLQSISAASSDLVGDGITLTGPLGAVLVRDLANGAGIRAGGTAVQRTNIRARVIGDGGEIRLGGAIEVLEAQQIGAVRITAVAAKRLSTTGDGQTGGRARVPGDFAAELNIRGTVGTVSVTGAVRGAKWTIGGDLQSLTVRGAVDGLTLSVGGTLASASLGTVRRAAIDVGRSVTAFTSTTFTSSFLYVGFKPIKAADPLTSATGAGFNRSLVTRIDSFIVTARTPAAFAGSTIAARQVGDVSLGSVATGTGPWFGVLADDSIRSVAVGTPRFSTVNMTAPGNRGIQHFRVRVV